MRMETAFFILSYWFLKPMAAPCHSASLSCLFHRVSRGRCQVSQALGASGVWLAGWRMDYTSPSCSGLLVLKLGVIQPALISEDFVWHRTMRFGPRPFWVHHQCLGTTGLFPWFLSFLMIYRSFLLMNEFWDHYIPGDAEAWSDLAFTGTFIGSLCSLISEVLAGRSLITLITARIRERIYLLI